MKMIDAKMGTLVMQFRPHCVKRVGTIISDHPLELSANGGRHMFAHVVFSWNPNGGTSSDWVALKELRRVRVTANGMFEPIEEEL